MALYLIHFDAPLHHARHYLGFAESVEAVPARLERHRAGNGAKIMAAVGRAGITWRLIRLWAEADRNAERALKNRNDNASLCPICRKARSRQKSKDRLKRLALRQEGGAS